MLKSMDICINSWISGYISIFRHHVLINKTILKQSHNFLVTSENFIVVARGAWATLSQNDEVSRMEREALSGGVNDGLFCRPSFFHQREINKLLLEITLMMLFLPGHLTVYLGGPEQLINPTSNNLISKAFGVILLGVRSIFSTFIYI